jgi:N-acetylglucosamine-6-phosphate deacetylase
MAQATSFPDAVSSSPASPSSTLLITHARLPGHEDLLCVWVDPQGFVRSIQPMAQAFKQPPPDRLQVLNLRGDWLSLGGVDLQINGALGLAFTDLEPENIGKLGEICQFLWRQGVDAFLPTLVTTSIPQIHRALATFKAYEQQIHRPGSAKILGIHLEGPCLNPEKRGAHPGEHLQPLTLPMMEEILGHYGDLVKMVTLAPELDPSGTVIGELTRRKIVVSLGHSQATAAQAQNAFRQGATLVTHAFNAMPPLHHREPGLLGAALVEPGIYCGVIADGHHVSPLMLKILLKAGSYSERLFLVSDALAPLGLGDGHYPWDDRQIEVHHGTARLGDGTLAGTTRSLLTGVCNLVRWKVCSVDEAIALGTTAPRRALGDRWEVSRRDRPFIGKPAHQLLRWNLDRDSHELTWQRLMTL